MKSQETKIKWTVAERDQNQTLIRRMTFRIWNQSTVTDHLLDIFFSQMIRWTLRERVFEKVVVSDSDL